MRPRKACAKGRFTDASFTYMTEHSQWGESLAVIARALRCHRNSCSTWMSRGVPPSEWMQRRAARKAPRGQKARLAARRKTVRRLVDTFFVKKGAPGPRGGTKGTIEIRRRQFPSLNDIRRGYAAATRRRPPSRATIRRDLLAMGYKSRRRQRTARLWAVDKGARIAFAERFRDTDATRFVFSDETNAKIDDNGSCATEWCRQAETPCPREVEQYPIRFHVWGAIGAGGWRALRMLHETVNADVYKRECLTPVLPRLRRRGTVFIHDGAKAHTASTPFLRQRGVHVPAWPAHSPDLNPIENMWGIVGQRVSARAPVSLEEFRTCFREEFLAVPNETVNRLVESFPARLRKCVRTRGATVRGPWQ